MIPSRIQRGFTLIELLVVIAVIAALMATLVPAYSAVQRRAKERATATLVAAIAGGIDTYGMKRWSWVEAGSERSRWLWDLNDDGLVDGDAEHEAGLSADLVGSGYRGFRIMAKAALTKQQIDPAGHPIDAWRRPLRIARAPYGTTWFNVWSAGPDGLDGTPDDLSSWRTPDAP